MYCCMDPLVEHGPIGASQGPKVKLSECAQTLLVLQDLPIIHE